MHLRKIAFNRFILETTAIILLVTTLGVPGARAQSTNPGEESVVLETQALIDEYDQTHNLETLRSAISRLRGATYEALDLSKATYQDFYLMPYLLIEAELKQLVHHLRRLPKDSLLSVQARSKIRELWLSIKRYEESPLPTSETSEEMEMKLENLEIIINRALLTVLEAARFLDHANSLSPLIRNMIDRAKRYDFMESPETDEVTFSRLQVTSEFLDLDYPNAEFLSNIFRANWLDFEADTTEEKHPSETSLSNSLRREAASLAQVAVQAATRPYARCTGYYLAARNTRTERPEDAVEFYDQAISQFGYFTDAQGGFLGKKFPKNEIRASFINFIFKYGETLVQRGNFVRYVGLIEHGWAIEGLEELHKYPLALRLMDAYSKLIAQLLEQENDQLVQEYKNKQQEIDAYLKVHEEAEP